MGHLLTEDAPILVVRHPEVGLVGGLSPCMAAGLDGDLGPYMVGDEDDHLRQKSLERELNFFEQEQEQEQERCAGISSSGRMSIGGLLKRSFETEAAAI